MAYYPKLSSPTFRRELLGLEEYRHYQVPQIKEIASAEDFNDRATAMCTGYEKFEYQNFIQHYLSNRSPYKSMLVYHGVGVGKTCSAITLAESLMYNSTREEDRQVYIVTKEALHDTFIDQVHNIAKELPDDLYDQCLGKTYYNLVNRNPAYRGIDATVTSKLDEVKKQFKDNVTKAIKSRYKLITYSKMVDIFKVDARNKKQFNNLTIIIDEAHNLRTHDAIIGLGAPGTARTARTAQTGGATTTKANIISALVNTLRKGHNNRLVLMTATPMYNEPKEIFWLLALLLVNDKREDLLPVFDANGNTDKKIFDAINPQSKVFQQLLASLSGTYISYIRGSNPFTMATALSPDVNEKSHSFQMSNKMNHLDYNIVFTRMTQEQRISLNAVGPDDAADEDMIVLDADEDGSESSSVSSESSKRGEDRVASEFKETINVKNKEKMNQIIYPPRGDISSYIPYKIIDTKMPQIQYAYKKIDGKVVRPDFFKPDGKWLPKYAPKIQQIAKLIGDTENPGVFVVWSHHIQNGLLPLAFALEHLGFKRNFGTSQGNMLVTGAAAGHGLSYAILTADQKLTKGGSKNDAAVLSILRSPENKDGSLIKIVLISDRASEGINIKHVRQIHLLAPWYHINKMNQVIGRGIRTCSHMDLPLEDRNVTVYLHALIDLKNKSNDTEDIRIYKIVDKKIKGMRMLEKIVRDNALDCPLMKNINYIPESLFTKVGPGIGHKRHFEPMCDLPHRSESAIRQQARDEVYANIITTAIQRVRRYMKTNNMTHGSRITGTELQKVIRVNEPANAGYVVLEYMLVPHAIMQNKQLVKHNGDFYILRNVKVDPIPKTLVDVKPLTLSPSVAIKKAAQAAPSAVANESLKRILEITDPIDFYMALSPSSWEAFIEYACEHPLAKEFQFLIDEGALITERDIVASGSPKTVIGGVNIFGLFHEEKKPFADSDLIIPQNVVNARQKNAEQIAKQMNSLKYRKNVLAGALPKIPQVIAFIGPIAKNQKIGVRILKPDSKDKNGAYGIVCTTISAIDTDLLAYNLLDRAAIPNLKNSKDLKCAYALNKHLKNIGNNNMITHPRIFLPPAWKPPV
jgi:hypothetical protein